MGSASTHSGGCVCSLRCQRFGQPRHALFNFGIVCPGSWKRPSTLFSLHTVTWQQCVCVFSFSRCGELWQFCQVYLSMDWFSLSVETFSLCFEDCPVIANDGIFNRLTKQLVNSWTVELKLFRSFQNIFQLWIEPCFSFLPPPKSNSSKFSKCRDGNKLVLYVIWTTKMAKPTVWPLYPMAKRKTSRRRPTLQPVSRKNRKTGTCSCGYRNSFDGRCVPKVTSFLKKLRWQTNHSLADN